MGCADDSGAGVTGGGQRVAHHAFGELLLQVEADDGLEGVSKALWWKPEAALVTLALPIIDGYVFARRMREAFGSAICLIASSPITV